ncbi:chymotrypsin-elastase inhibitor ixodidin [Fusarium austroafricanum]|uniref:Chymotrypsin-elastase inhibitor ixodidin n=1 Tax=Fusarium austroafricanum TaxID=2364996 RepID=A0A8H4K0Y1_9HYPO|nr:chymotrypsin-elastase inhibitor ixodidin [Fusarium austroafricanum]
MKSYISLIALFAAGALAAPAPTANQCTLDMLFVECGTACPLTCKSPKERPCTKQCVQGCFCKKGLLLNEETGKCVKPKDC